MNPTTKDTELFDILEMIIASGYKPKTLNTRLGPVTVEIPQVRD